MEKHFEIQTQDGTIRGLSHVPESSRKNKKLIVIIHGYFSANRVGPARLYVQIARSLSKQGFIVVRADMLGVGDSDGEFSSITYESEVRDIKRICGYVKETFGFTKVILLGHSMGSNLALRVARDRNDISQLILLAPDVEKQGGIDQLFSPQQQHELDANGYTIRKGLHISRSFIEEIHSDKPYSIAKQLDIPVAVIQGDEDELYSLKGARKLAEYACRGEFYLVPEADHNFLSAQSRRIMMDTIQKVLEKPFK